MDDCLPRCCPVVRVQCVFHSFRMNLFHGGNFLLLLQERSMELAESPSLLSILVRLQSVRSRYPHMLHHISPRCLHLHLRNCLSQPSKIHGNLLADHPPNCRNCMRSHPRGSYFPACCFLNTDDRPVCGISDDHSIRCIFSPILPYVDLGNQPSAEHE